MPATLRAPDYTSSRVVRLVRLTGPASYATGGEALAAANFGLSRLEGLILSGPATNATTGIKFAAYNYTTGKLMWFTDPGIMVEETATTDLSAYTLDAVAFGA